MFEIREADSALSTDRLSNLDYCVIGAAFEMVRIELSDRNWCKGDVAIDRAGRETDPSDRTAVAFCLQGALLRSLHEASSATYSGAMAVLNRAAERAPGGPWPSVFAFNDAPSTTIADMRVLLGVAIAEVETLARRHR